MTLGPSSEDLFRPAVGRWAEGGPAFPGLPYGARIGPGPSAPPLLRSPAPAPADRARHLLGPPVLAPDGPPGDVPRLVADGPLGAGAADGTGAGAGTGDDGAAPAEARRPGRATGLDPRLSFDTFVVGESNRLAYNASLGVAASTGCSYNPLFIHGDSGNGKTHLLHAIGHHVRQHFPDDDVRYVTCERFTSEFIAGIQSSPSGGFTSRYRSCSVLLVDDLQFLEGRVETQKEFFHTFNEVTSAGGRVVLSADCHPGAIPTLSDRLRTRFASGLVADLGAPDFDTRSAILANKAAVAGVDVDHDVLSSIAAAVTRSVRDLVGALTRVLADAALDDRAVTVAGARASLRSFLGGSGPTLTCSRIMEEAAEVFGVSVEALCGYSRTRALVQARQSAMYVCRTLTEESLPAIGRAFGHRDHTTVLHAVRRIEELMAERAALYAKVMELTHRLAGLRGGCEGRPPG